MCEKPPADVNLWDTGTLLLESAGSCGDTITRALNRRIPWITDKDSLNGKFAGPESSPPSLQFSLVEAFTHIC